MNLRTLCLAVSAVLLASAAGAQTPPAPSGKKVGVVLNTLTSAFDVRFKHVLEAEAEKHGVAVVVRAPPTVQANDARVALIRSMEKARCDVVMVAPRSGFHAAFLPAVDSLKQQGIKVLSLLEPFEGAGIPMVGLDEESQVNMAVDLAAALVSNDDEIGLLRSVSMDGKTIGRKESQFMQGMKKAHPTVVFRMDRFVSINSDPQQDTAQAKALMEGHPNLKLIYCPYTQSSLAMIRGIRETNRVGKLRVICMGASLPKEVEAAIQDGVIDAWVAVLPDAAAKRALALAMDLMAGKPVPDVSREKAVIITKKNLQDPEIRAVMTD